MKHHAAQRKLKRPVATTVIAAWRESYLRGVATMLAIVDAQIVRGIVQLAEPKNQ